MNATYLVLLAAVTTTGMTVGPNLRHPGIRLTVGMVTAVALLLLAAELLREAV